MIFPFKVFDLTHTLSPKTASWNGGCGFKHEVKLDYDDHPENKGFRIQQIKMHAGIGTHIDAPVHCIKNGKCVSEIDLNTLIVPCYILDISEQAHESYTVSKKEIQQFQEKHNIKLNKTFFAIKTGWQKFWNSPDKYRNNLIFPSLSEDGAQYLSSQNIFGLGIDTLSPDCGTSDFPTHRILLGNNQYIVENIYFDPNFPHIGGFIIIAPIKTKDGTEAPVRLIGLAPR